MKVLVVGATGGSGRATVDHLLSAGHEVTAFTRSPGGTKQPRLSYAIGDAMKPADLDRAVADHDAVVVILGISENPMRVRLLGPSHTPKDVRSQGTGNVIEAMRNHGVRKLVVQTAFGVGESKPGLTRTNRLFYKLILAPQIDDTERQEALVRSSGLDWVLVRPVNLTDEPHDGMPSDAAKPVLHTVSRASVGRFNAHAVDNAELVGKAVTLSTKVG
ncbi:NAD(P)-dependent oxidoreductase [Nocardia sp. XZ_19_385]|uniref:NAD(P)-dependent oxidoreductase n=1 Tax=Nocardia sp. XZ_19_385 TaxID=2769488 RepID=UPI0018903E66|nr:NAD(P)-binding oxidoreductase [Nocardia sp. XZ_19_385]